MTEVKQGRPFKAIQKTTTPPKNNRYYSVREAVDLIGLSRKTIEANLRRGRIRGKLMGEGWRIYRDEIFDNSGYTYFFDCPDAIWGEKYLTPLECGRLSGRKKSLLEGEIIAIAHNMESSLYRCEKDAVDGNKREICIYDAEI